MNKKCFFSIEMMSNFLASILYPDFTSGLKFKFNFCNLILISFLIFSLSPKLAHANTQPNQDGISLRLTSNVKFCKVEISSNFVEVLLCETHNNQTSANYSDNSDLVLDYLVVVKVASEISGSRQNSPFVAKAFFSNKNNNRVMAFTQKIWRHFWVESQANSLSEGQQIEMRKAVFYADHSKIDVRTRSVIDFLANFVEPDQVIENQNSSLGLENFWSLSSLMTFNMICSSIGRLHEAHFTDADSKSDVDPTVNDSNLISRMAIVGEPASHCRGRCGFGCEKPFQWRPNQYTQECFDHDLCRVEYGNILGKCSKEFTSAAHGYLVAPDCPSLPNSSIP